MPHIWALDLLSSGRGRRAAGLLAGGVMVAVFLLVGMSLWVNLSPGQDVVLPTESAYEPFFDDYVVYWVAGRQVLTGETDDLYDLDTVKRAQAAATEQRGEDVLLLPYFNPPFVAGLLTPFAVLPLKASAILFGLVSLMALGLALRVLLAGIGGTEAAMWTLGVVSSMPFYYTMVHGQFSFILLLLFAAMYVLLKRGEDTRAGVVLALLLLKPPLVLLPLAFLVLERRFAAVRAFGVAAVFLVLASLLIGGWSSAVAYPRLLIDAVTWDGESGILIWAMYGWNAFFRGILGEVDASVITLTAIAASLYTIKLGLGAWRVQPQSFEWSFDLRYSVLILGVLLTSPHLYGQDLILVAIPAILLYRSSTDPVARLALAGVFFCGWLLLYQHFTVLGFSGVNFVTLYLLGLLLLDVARLRRSAWLGAGWGDAREFVVSRRWARDEVDAAIAATSRHAG